MSSSPGNIRRYSLRSRLLLVSGATFLLCAGAILMFFPLLNLSLEGALEGSTILMEEAKNQEADTIARLMVLEFSQMRDLLEARPGEIDEVDQRIMNLIWQKVTFNEVIKGIELIRSPEDAEGQRLTYFFYRREARMLEPMSGPQKVLKRFSGKERELLDNILSPATPQRDKLETQVYLGPKAEGQMLLRYLPVHVLVPDEGAIFWGVAKIGVDVSSLADLKTMQDRERHQLRRAVWLAVVLSLVAAGILAVSLLYLWARGLTEPLRLLSDLVRDFRRLDPGDYQLWLDNLKHLEDRGQVEILELKETLVRLGQSLSRLGEFLFASEPQACLTRVAVRALPALLSPSGRGNPREPGGPPRPGASAGLREVLHAWQELAQAPGEEWEKFDPALPLQRAWSLISPGLPATLASQGVVQAVPPVWGSPVHFGQAVLLLLEYAAGIVPADGTLNSWAGRSPDGGLLVRITTSGPPFTPEDCEALLQPRYGEYRPGGRLGPAVAAALVRWQGGELTAAPAAPSGLVLTLRLPPAPEP